MTDLVFWNRLTRNICKALKQRGISHMEMAAELGMTPAQFSTRIHNNIHFSVLEVYKIADECLMKIEDFLKD